MKLVVEDEADLAQKLFDAIFKEDSENRQNDVCCTEADGKEQLNIIQFSCCPCYIDITHTTVYSCQSAKSSFQRYKRLKKIVGKLNNRIQYV